MYHILYVDDEPDLLELGKLFLEKSCRFHVDTVTSAPEALQILKSTSYDAIVSDYQMPGMDGIAFLKAVRTEFPELPFIIFTGKGREEVVIEAFNNGADSYLQKGGEPTPQFFELGHKITSAVRRRKAEKELQESEIRYRNVVEDQTEFISRFLPDGTHVFVNEAYCRYFNKKREEILGKKFKPDIPKEDQSRVEEHFLSLTKEHPIAVIEHRIVMPDGEIRWQQWSDRAIFNDIGTLIEFQSVGRDITERKHSEEELRVKNVELHAAYEQIAATEQQLRHNYNELDNKEQKLRESEQLYRTIVETAPGMLVICDSKGRNLYVSANCRNITGYTREELLGKIVWWVHEDDTPRMKALLKDTLENQISGHNVEFKGVKKDGEIWFGSQSWEPIKDTQGTMVEFVMQVIDITDRKKMEETLKQSEHRFFNIINNLPDATLAIDPNGKVIAWNKAIEEMTGVKAQDMVGKDKFEYAIPFYGKRRPILIDLIFKSDEETAKNYSGIIHKKPNVLIAKTTLPQPKGKKSILWAKASPLYDDRGNVVGAIESIRDITDRKEAERL
jgi:PAS domain S-box-containing protein